MFLGMRGTGDWVTDQRPMNWRQNIMYLYPNGSAPLTAILSMMSSERVNDPQFHWWTLQRGSVSGAIAGVFTLPDLSAAYAAGGVAGDYLYLTVTDALSKQIRIGHQLLLRDASDYSVDVNAKVTNVTTDGTTGVITVMLLEADDNSATHDLSDADNLLVIGNINPEGGEMPDAISLNPTKHYNYTQIFRTPLSITRTARRTSLRTGDDYQKAKRECLEVHSIEMELAFLWGIMTERTGDNGKPERTTQGVINFIRANAAANCQDFTAVHAGSTWLAAGELWLDTILEQIFRYGAEDKLMLCGSGALLGINRLAKNSGQINLQPTSKAYGMQIMQWITPFGTIYCKTHPLFSYDATTRNMGVILEPKELTYRYIDDTAFYNEAQSKSHSMGTGSRRIDGTDEEYLTEAGLEFGFPLKCGVLNGIGLDG